MIFCVMSAWNSGSRAQDLAFMVSARGLGSGIKSLGIKSLDIKSPGIKSLGRVPWA